MPATADVVRNTGSAIATLRGYLSGGGQVVRELFEGDSIVIGSLDGCDLQLTDTEVAGTHCILGVDDGTVWIRDCYSPSGTYVDNHRVSDMQLHNSAAIRIGPCELSLHVHGTPEPSSDPAALLAEELAVDTTQLPESPEDQPSNDTGIDAAPAESSHLAELPGPDPLHETSQSVNAPDKSSPMDETVEDEQVQPHVELLKEQLAQSQTEAEQLRQQITLMEQRQAFSQPVATSTEADPFQEEMIELLRAEISELQNELAQRDARMLEMQAGGSVAAQDDLPIASKEELETLVTRLEELLEELQRKEENISLLEELLRATDDANRAEQEERHQLEIWVKNIEQRMADREQEWQANAERLEETIGRLTTQKEQLEQTLEQTVSGGHAAAVHHELTEGLRREAAELRAQLETSEKERIHFRQRAESAEQRLSDVPTPEQTADLARQRAELARQRADLQAQRQAESQQQQQQRQAEVEAHRQQQEYSSAGPTAEQQVDSTGTGEALASQRPAQSITGLGEGHRPQIQPEASPPEQNVAQRARPHAGVRETDERIRALRQHMRTSDDTTEPSKRPNLSSRIANLWRKLENPDC